MPEHSTKLYKEFCKCAGLTNLIRLNTHYGNDNDPSSCIDHFLTSSPELYSQCGVCPYMESDHMVIYGSRKKFKIKRNMNFIRAHSYGNYNPLVFSNAIADMDWQEVYAETDIDKCWDIFCKEFISIMDRFLPYRNMKFSNEPPPWADQHFFLVPMKGTEL